VRVPSFTGLGYLPDLTPAHQDDLLTGINGGIGGSALGLPTICGNLKKPVLWIVAIDDIGIYCTSLIERLLIMHTLKSSPTSKI
jgi:hypothetical protein